MKNWRDIQYQPPHDGRDWATWRFGRPVAQSFDTLNSSARMFDLVGQPGQNVFLPAIMISGLAQRAGSRFRRQQNYLAIVYGSFAGLMLLSALYFTSIQAALWSVCLGALALITFLDLCANLSDGPGIQERALFFNWVARSREVRFCAGLTVLGLTLTGTLQLWLMAEMGGLEGAFSFAGAMYPDIKAGEYWRVLSGPYLHYSAAHFLTNFFMLLMANALALVGYGWRIVPLFIIGNVAGCLAQVYLGPQLLDNCGGISAGIYALFGAVSILHLAPTGTMPRGLPAICLALSLVGILCAELLSPAAATTAHVAGLLSGMIIGYGDSLLNRIR